MGVIVDTNVFIYFEKEGKDIDLSPWGHSGRRYSSVVTISELLIGVHRANTEERRRKRFAFVETVISGVHYNRQAVLEYDRAKSEQLVIDARYLRVSAIP